MVPDHGEGAPRNAVRLFEPFFTTARTEGGTGMGLPIIKALLVARDGSIEFFWRERWDGVFGAVGGSEGTTYKV